MPSLTEQLARFMVAFSGERLPGHVLAAAERAVLDWTGAALAGTATPAGRKLLRYGAAQAPGPATVVGLGQGRSAETAALANGTLSHTLELDDAHRASFIHPGSPVIPAALAVAEQEGVTGLEFLAAVVLGYEVAIRVGEAAGATHYRFWHHTATCGTFGAAAAAAWLLGLDEEQTAHAFGQAGTMAGGLWEFSVEGAMTKSLHPGQAAAKGVLAATLGGLGLSGARTILEGKRGFLSAMSQAPDPEAVVRNLGPEMSAYRIEEVSFKPHASCRHTHSAVDAALALRQRPAFDVAQIEQVTVDTYQAALDIAGTLNPAHPFAAKFSLPYCVVTALQEGHLDVADFSEEKLQDPAVRGLMGRTTVRQDPLLEARYPLEWTARVALKLEDGTELVETVEIPKGAPESPMSRDELETKFRQLAQGVGAQPLVEPTLAWVRELATKERVEFPVRNWQGVADEL